MPCYDPETHNQPIRLENKVHKLTALLCGFCRHIESVHPSLISENKDVAEWWDNHKKHDAMVAMVREKQKRIGYQNLTDNEKDVILKSNDASL